MTDNVLPVGNQNLNGHEERIGLVAVKNVVISSIKKNNPSNLGR